MKPSRAAAAAASSAVSTAFAGVGQPWQEPSDQPEHPALGVALLVGLIAFAILKLFKK